MSVLSEQCEALRMWAKQLREGEPVLASDLREAADTILNLRDMAQQAQSEKAALERRIDELCAEVEALKRDEWAAGFSAGCDAVEAAYEDGRSYYEAENAKLRELVSDMGKMLTLASWTSVENDEQASQCIYRAEALGIEVD